LVTPEKQKEHPQKKRLPVALSHGTGPALFTRVLRDQETDVDSVVRVVEVLRESPELRAVFRELAGLNDGQRSEAFRSIGRRMMAAGEPGELWFTLELLSNPKIFWMVRQVL
jgi:hypothetical protein